MGSAAGGTRAALHLREVHDVTAPILLIDDDDDLRSALATGLARAGFATVQADDGAAGIAILHGGLRPSLIILDHDMPVLDGAGFREAQLAFPAYAHIPLLVLTGSDVQELVEATRPNAYLKKPIALNPLMSIVRLLVAQPVAHAAPPG